MHEDNRIRLLTSALNGLLSGMTAGEREALMDLPDELRGRGYDEDAPRRRRSRVTLLAQQLADEIERMEDV